MDDLEKLTEPELHALLISYGVDPQELSRMMLERLYAERAKGFDTPMLHEAIRQFEAVARAHKLAVDIQDGSA